MAENKHHRILEENRPPKRRRRKGRDDMPQIGVRLTADQLSDLDQIADESGGRYNRSDLIREAVDEFLSRRRRPLKE